MKDLGGSEHVLGVRIRRQREQHTLYLSHEKYIDKVLDRFCMADAKPLGVLLQPYDKISKEDCPKTREPINYMQGVPYALACGSLMYAMVATRPDIAYGFNIKNSFSTSDLTLVIK